MPLVRKFASLSFLFFICLVLGSCKKDDISRKNYVKFNRSTYDLNAADSYFEVYPCDDTHCNVDFYLVNEESKVELRLELYSLGTDEFVGGNFTMGTNNAPEAIPDYNFFEDDYIKIGDNYYFPESGKVTAKKLSEENEWRFDFNYVYPSGVKVRGNFVGILDEQLPILD